MSAEFLFTIGGIRLGLSLREELLDPPFILYAHDQTDPQLSLPPDFHLTVLEDGPPPGPPPPAAMWHRLPADGELPTEHGQDARATITLLSGDEIRIDSPRFAGRLDLARGWGEFHQGRDTRDYRVALQVILSHLMVPRGGLLIHGAGLAQPPEGAEGPGGGPGAGAAGRLFVGPSGSGKSTVAALSEWPVLSDELCAVDVRHPGGPVLSGTPLGLCTTTAGFPLRGICLLEQSPRDELEPVAPASALPLLLAQTVGGAGEPGQCARVFERAADLVERVPVGRLRFTRSREFVRLM